MFERVFTVDQKKKVSLQKPDHLRGFQQTTLRQHICSIQLNKQSLQVLFYAART